MKICTVCYNAAERKLEFLREDSRAFETWKVDIELDTQANGDFELVTRNRTIDLCSVHSVQLEQFLRDGSINHES